MALYNYSEITINKKVLAGMADPRRFGILRESLEQLDEKGVKAIITLNESALPLSGKWQNTFKYIHIPITDFHAPTIDQVKQAVNFWRLYRDTGTVVAHCSAGIGRTGTVLSCILISEGLTAADAILRVRTERPGSVETQAQEHLINQYATLAKK